MASGGRRWPALISILLVLFTPANGAAQIDPASVEHPLHQLGLLEGSWAGNIDGTLGPAVGQRQYRFIMRGRFLLMLHDRDPEEPSPEGDTHEEWSMFSVDTQHEVIVLREFLVEGFVNRYTCEMDAGPTTLTCSGEATEGSSRLLVRLRYEFADVDQFTEVFEIFEPGGAVQVQMVGRWVRTSERG